MSWDDVIRHPLVSSKLSSEIKFDQQLESRIAMLMNKIRTKIISSKIDLTELFHKLDLSGD